MLGIQISCKLEERSEGMFSFDENLSPLKGYTAGGSQLPGIQGISLLLKTLMYAMPSSQQTMQQHAVQTLMHAIEVAGRPPPRLHAGFSNALWLMPQAQTVFDVCCHQ